MSFYVVAGMAEATLGRAVRVPYILPQTKVFLSEDSEFSCAASRRTPLHREKNRKGL